MLTLTDYIACAVGILMYAAWMLSSKKNEPDEKGEVFSLKSYAKRTWDDWLFAVVSAYGLLFFAPDLILPMLSAVFGLDSWGSAASLLVGLLSTVIVQKLIQRWKGKGGAAKKAKTSQNGKEWPDEI